MLTDDLRFALALADRADAITMAAHTGRPVACVSKADGTPVTVTDRLAEEAMREMVVESRPTDGFVGEETGSTGSGRRRWIADPIDGTRSFIEGHRAWGTLIALEVDGEIVVGVASAPAVGSR